MTAILLIVRKILKYAQQSHDRIARSHKNFLKIKLINRRRVKSTLI